MQKYLDNENLLEVVKETFKIEYYLNGELHRNDGPAVIRYYSNYIIKFEEYYLNGELHRNDGPADIFYDEYGFVINESYYKNGKKHREDGPAAIEYLLNGKINHEKYYYNGIEFDLDKLPFELPIDSEEKEFLFKLKYGDKND